MSTDSELKAAAERLRSIVPDERMWDEPAAQWSDIDKDLWVCAFGFVRHILAQRADDGARMIAAERQRQIESEGWSAEHDDQHSGLSLQAAAESYMVYGCNPRFPPGMPPMLWPWADGWWKPSHNMVRNLVKAGALIAAEIDRLKRKESALGVQSGGDAG